MNDFSNNSLTFFNENDLEQLIDNLFYTNIALIINIARVLNISGYLNEEDFGSIESGIINKDNDNLSVYKEILIKALKNRYKEVGSTGLHYHISSLIAETNDIVIKLIINKLKEESAV